MHKDLILHFIETQALILSPICPHIAETIWLMLGKVKRSEFFKLENLVKFYFVQTESVMKAKWPTADAVDHMLLKTSKFFENTIYEFRIRLKAYLQPKGKVKCVEILFKNCIFIKFPLSI